ncbi:MAG: AraC family transcriptional regulator [Lachnospira sp.]|uniref:AraC-type DNA-binding protein n=1 Tax=Lachnospira pectinoschiza TaxID=28052 RepID=A0A1G9XP97_9FIRM|nr:AraC family transcriptional regulator [Lachnospira pectinoschiza]MCR5515763.1 AraC family transcriptional regulator [Lachnospira sp.]SDM98331.1 AraC-type DNA-binding protein [Lachnospira pectinoschiza]
MLKNVPKEFNIQRIKRDASFKPSSTHSHPFHEIFYLVSGQCKVFIDHNIYTFNKGDIAIVPAGTLHKTDYTGKGIHERIVISFTEEQVHWLNNYAGDGVVEGFLSANDVFSIPDRRRDYAETLMNKLLFEKNNPDILSPAFISTSLSELLLFIIRCKKFEDNVVKEIDTNNQIMQEIATYIYNHYNEPLMLDDIAHQFNLSRSYLSKKFKASTGFGFKEYMINIRIKKACELLLGTNKTITEIAFECGFNDSNYFGDAFRRIKGVSPHKYRKNAETF